MCLRKSALLILALLALDRAGRRRLGLGRHRCERHRREDGSHRHLRHGRRSLRGIEKKAEGVTPRAAVLLIHGSGIGYSYFDFEAVPNYSMMD